MFGGNTENDMSDLGTLIEKEEMAIMKKLFQEDIEAIKTSKEDLDKNILTEAYLKRIRSIPSELLAASL